MDKEKVKKILKVVLIVFVVLTSLAFWAENVFLYFLGSDFVDGPTIEPGVPVYNVG